MMGSKKKPQLSNQVRSTVGYSMSVRSKLRATARKLAAGCCETSHFGPCLYYFIQPGKKAIMVATEPTRNCHGRIAMFTVSASLPIQRGGAQAHMSQWRSNYLSITCITSNHRLHEKQANNHSRRKHGILAGHVWGTATGNHPRSTTVCP